MLRLFILGAIAFAVHSQSITPAAMKKIFKYADATLVKKLTTSLNKDKSVSAQKKRLSTWAPKNAIKKGAKVDSKSSVSTAAGALEAANEFMDHRAALKKFIDFQYNFFKKDFIGTKTSKQFRKIFWAQDKSKNNDLDATIAAFVPKMMAKLKPAKQAKVMDEIQKVQNNFAKKDPAAAAALMGYKSPQ